MATKTKRKLIEQTEANAVLDSVKDIKINDVVSQFSNLQVTVQKTLADMSATVTTKVQQMEQLDTAIGLKHARLQELHNIEKEAISLDEMRVQREQEKELWDLNRQERQKTWEEEESEFAKTRNRKEDDWKYEFEQKKKRVAEEFEAQVARTKREEQNRHELAERSWLEREAAIKNKETEFQALQTQVAGLDVRIAEATKKAEAVTSAVVTHKFNHEMALLRKDAESAKAVSDMRVNALTSQIAGLENQIEDLQTQLISARQDAKDIASSALESVSQKQVSEALTKVIEQRDVVVGKNK